MVNISDYSDYMNFVMGIPILSEEEEHKLFSEYSKTKSKELSDRIVKSFLRVPVSLVERKYYWSDIPKADLIQEGTLGIIQAIETFDHNAGTRFYSYAIGYVKSRICTMIHDFGKPIRFATTKPRKLIQNNYSKFSSGGLSLSSDEKKRMSESLSVNSSDITEYEKFRNSAFVSIEADRDDENYTLEETLASEEQETPLNVYALIDEPYRNVLSSRERLVIDSRWISNNKTLGEVAEEIRVSPERVRQIESSAFAKIRKHLS